MINLLLAASLAACIIYGDQPTRIVAAVAIAIILALFRQEPALESVGVFPRLYSRIRHTDWRRLMHRLDRPTAAFVSVISLYCVALAWRDPSSGDVILTSLIAMVMAVFLYQGFIAVDDAIVTLGGPKATWDAIVATYHERRTQRPIRLRLPQLPALPTLPQVDWRAWITTRTLDLCYAFTLLIIFIALVSNLVVVQVTVATVLLLLAKPAWMKLKQHMRTEAMYSLIRQAISPSALAKLTYNPEDGP